MADEDVEDGAEAVHCPEDGFHHNDKDGNHDSTAFGDEAEKAPQTERVKFLRETIRHCRHFISMVACPQWQILSMEIVAASIVGLSLEQ